MRYIKLVLIVGFSIFVTSCTSKVIKPINVNMNDFQNMLMSPVPKGCMWTHNGHKMTKNLYFFNYICIEKNHLWVGESINIKKIIKINKKFIHFVNNSNTDMNMAIIGESDYIFDKKNKVKSIKGIRFKNELIMIDE